MKEYKILIFSGENHEDDAIEMSKQEIINRGYNGDTNLWWGVLKSQTADRTALLIEDTDEDKVNLTQEQKSALVDVDVNDEEWFRQ